MEVTLAYLSEKFGVAHTTIVSALYAAGIDPVEFGEAGQAVAYPEVAMDFLLEHFALAEPDAIEAQAAEVAAERPTFVPATARAKLTPDWQTLSTEAAE